MDLLTGADIYRMAQDTFGTKDVTPEQLKYVISREVPAMYLLENHSVKGHKMTFNISNRDQAKAQAHRP